MTELAKQHCEACRIDAPKVSATEATELGRDIPDWQQIRDDGLDKLRRVYSFDDFQAALDFANRVGDIAEAEGHHPALLVEWGRVTVDWWSHKIRGLHRNDFVMAAKTDHLANAPA